MDQEWTLQGIADWAVQVGLQPALLGTGTGVMISQPGRKRAIFAIYLKQAGDYVVEVAFNPDNEQSWLLREQLQSQYDQIAIDEGSRKWPRIGIAEYTNKLLSQIAAWAAEYIVSPWMPKPVPVKAEGSDEDRIPKPGPADPEAGGAPSMPPPTQAVEEDKKLTRWLSSYFAVRGIPRPDGRALFAYKTTNKEFEKISKQLQIAVVFRGHKVLQKDSSFAALFVLFASEWWRREYRGGPWTWVPIYEAIGLQPEAITRLQTSPQGLLYPALERGFRFWKREVFSMEYGRTFIGSIAAEGGLPLNLLADAQGGLKRYFRHVLDRYLPLRPAGVSASQVASELNSELPASFRRDQVYRVVGGIVEATLDLRAQYALAGQDDPVAHLDRVDPDWRERFPLSLDNEPAQALLSDLLVTAASRSDTGVPLSLIRYLTQDCQGMHRLNAEVEIPKKLSIAALASLFGELDWPSVAEVWVLRPFKARLAVCSRTDREHYRVRPDGVVWHGHNAMADVTVGIYSYGQAIGEERSLPGALLETDLPWVFVAKDNRLVYLGQGGMRLSTDSVTVAVPKATGVNVEGEDAECQGEINDLSRLVYLGGGTLYMRSGEEQFTIRTRQPTIEMRQYGLAGKRFFGRTNLRQVFLGPPRLYCQEVGKPSRSVPMAAVLWRPAGSNGNWQSWSSTMQGVVDVKATDGQEVLFRSRIGVLPDHFDFQPRPGEDENKGEIVVAGLTGVRLAVDHQGVAVDIAQPEEGCFSLQIHRRDESLSAFPLEIQWPAMPKALRLTMPMPVAGARFGSEDERWLPDRALVAVADLAGIHAVGFNHTGRAPEQFRLDISLRARDLTGADLRALSDRLLLPRNGDVSDLPLIQLRERFLQLLSLSDDLDCRIELTLEGSRVYLRLYVARYIHQLNVKEHTIAVESAQYRGLVDQADIDAMDLEVRSLINPVERGYALNPCSSDGVRTGEWEKPATLKPGPWLVMPPRMNGQSVRPTILAQAGYIPKNDDRLRDAIANADEGERRDAISACIRRMAFDYGHKDWRLIFATLAAFQHLPATTLDLWDCFARDPTSMAMLLIAADETNYQGVIDLAAELPFTWELVPLGAWNSALMAVKQYVEDAAPEGLGPTLVEHVLKQKLGFMLEADPILERVVKILAARLLGFEDEEIQEAQRLAAIPSLIDHLMAAASADLRNRQAADAYWPVMPGDWLNRMRAVSPETCGALFTQQASYMTSVLHAPVALAVRTGLQLVGSHYAPGHADLYALYQIRQFDDTWYQEAFGLTLLFLYAMRELRYQNEEAENN